MELTFQVEEALVILCKASIFAFSHFSFFNLGYISQLYWGNYLSVSVYGVTDCESKYSYTLIKDWKPDESLLDMQNLRPHSRSTESEPTF